MTRYTRSSLRRARVTIDSYIRSIRLLTNHTARRAMARMKMYALMRKPLPYPYIRSRK